MMKLTCTEPGCGTTIQTSADNGAKLMAEHVRLQHGSLELKHTQVLEACRNAFAEVIAGARLYPKAARILHDQVCDLLAKPHAVSVQGETNVHDSSNDVHQAMPVTENPIASQLPGNGGDPHPV